jgi:hypothetical protein
MTNATIVAGTLEVEIDVRGNLSQQVLQDMFQRAIASAVEVLPDFVMKVEVTEIEQGSGSRRLQSIETKRYEVAYQVVVASHMDPNDVVEKANRIAVPGTAESQLFRDALMATDGVERVGKIAAKIAAYKVGDEASTLPPSTPKNQAKDEKPWKSLAIGAIAIVLGLSCLAITSAILIKRKFASSELGESAPSGSEADIEHGRCNLVNDTKMAPGDLRMNATVQESSMNSTPQESKCAVEGVLVESTTAPTAQATEVAPIAKEGNSRDPLQEVVVPFPQRRLVSL